MILESVMNGKKPVINLGLKGVYVAETRICKIDSERGKIYYFGYDLDELAEKSSFEEVLYLLLYGDLPSKREFIEFNERIRDRMSLPPKLVDLITNIPHDVELMEGLRTVISYLGNLNGDGLERGDDDIRDKAVDLIAKMPAIIAYLYRSRTDNEFLTPRENLSLAGNLLYLLTGREYDDRDVRGLDMSLILYAEHGVNASTFAATVVASTGSDYYSSIVAGIGALRGPLHGYANTAALEQFLEIGGPENVEKWFEENIASRKRRLMGFGHRLYRIHDPRAKHYKKWLEENMDRFDEDSRRVVETAFKLYEVAMNSFLAEKNIYPNCDYWSAQMYYALKLPKEVYTPIFAMSRISGWTAHIMEYIKENVLIRPRAYYVGEIGKKYIPIDMRE